MMRSVRARWAALGLAAAVVGLCGPAARAQSVPLPAGSEAVPLPFIPTAGSPLPLQTSSSFFSSQTFTGFLRAGVFRNELGTLDFYYQVTNNPTSTTSLGRVATIDFSGFTTSVFYRTDNAGLSAFLAGTETPDTADRDTGGSVGFNFLEGLDPLTSGKINPGETTSILVVRTNATNYATGLTSVIDGGAATITTFAPAPVPEPAAALVVLGAAAVVPLLGRRNRSA